ATKVFQADGQAKIGNFTLGFDDLSIPLAGIPITLTRTYDSRDTSAGDFGNGWRLSTGTAAVTKSSVLGAAFEQYVENVGTNSVEESPAVVGPVNLLDRRTGEVYNPTRWKLTTADGVVYVIGEGGIESVTDRNGNTVTYAADGFEHSSGAKVTIQRDDAGRV